MLIEVIRLDYYFVLLNPWTDSVNFFAESTGDVYYQEEKDRLVWD